MKGKVVMLFVVGLLISNFVYGEGPVDPKKEIFSQEEVPATHQKISPQEAATLPATFQRMASGYQSMIDFLKVKGCTVTAQQTKKSGNEEVYSIIFTIPSSQEQNEIIILNQQNNIGMKVNRVNLYRISEKVFFVQEQNYFIVEKLIKGASSYPTVYLVWKDGVGIEESSQPPAPVASQEQKLQNPDSLSATQPNGKDPLSSTPERQLKDSRDKIDQARDSEWTLQEARLCMGGVVEYLKRKEITYTTVPSSEEGVAQIIQITVNPKQSQSLSLKAEGNKIYLTLGTDTYEVVGSTSFSTLGNQGFLVKNQAGADILLTWQASQGFIAQPYTSPEEKAHQDTRTDSIRGNVQDIQTSLQNVMTYLQGMQATFGQAQIVTFLAEGIQRLNNVWELKVVENSSQVLTPAATGAPESKIHITIPTGRRAQPFITQILTLSQGTGLSSPSEAALCLRISTAQGDASYKVVQVGDQYIAVSDQKGQELYLYLSEYEGLKVTPHVRDIPKSSQDSRDSLMAKRIEANASLHQAVCDFLLPRWPGALPTAHPKGFSLTLATGKEQLILPEVQDNGEWVIKITETADNGSRLSSSYTLRIEEMRSDILAKLQQGKANEVFVGQMQNKNYIPVYDQEGRRKYLVVHAERGFIPQDEKPKPDAMPVKTEEDSWLTRFFRWIFHLITFQWSKL